MKKLYCIVILLLCTVTALAQVSAEQHAAEKLANMQAGSWGRDTTSASKDKEVPYGVFQWTIDERLGDVIPAENTDTAVENFQNWKLTDGMNGEYSYLGTSGSPRLSRIFMNRKEDKEFIFLNPYDYFLKGIKDFRFTNTLSPITNLAYHSCGSKETGEDRVYANFAKNINKVAGVGFNIDYLYARGYYNNSSNSQFGGTVFGYYRGERYSAHAYISANHSKTAENGGIEDDNYILNPQSFPQSYDSDDIPVCLANCFNRNDDQTYFLTHRYNLGYTKDVIVPDSLKPKPPSESEMLFHLSDSLRQVLHTDSLQRKIVLDSLYLEWEKNQVQPTEFVPVASIIHTLRVKNMMHILYNNEDDSDYFTNHFYGNAGSVHDEAYLLSVRNTLGFQMREGFKKWAKMNITAFATHEYRRYRECVRVASGLDMEDTETENDFLVGGEISKTMGQMLHYKVNGEVCLIGTNVGDFDVKGRGDLNFPMKKDSLQIGVNAGIQVQRPGFWMRNYYNQYTDLDCDDRLSREFRARVEGEFRLKKFGTNLRVGFEHINNYTYFAINNQMKGTDGLTGKKPEDYLHDVMVDQVSNVQVFSATLAQPLHYGILHFDNEVTVQHSTNQDALPLPLVNIYSNLYIVFRIAKVLRVQMGADLRFFTSYYAPDYATQIGQFAVQDTKYDRVKIGNYPIVNCYVNMHIKRLRMYVAANHVNAGHGNMFLVPHHPINPLTINFGLSWNFLN